MQYNGYLNTDLDLLGEEPFNTVMMELGYVSILHYEKQENGTWSACVESQESAQSCTCKERSPEDNILPLIKLIKQMSASAQEEWRRLTKRDFATCSVTIYPYSEDTTKNEELS